MVKEGTDIRSLTLGEIETYFTEAGERPYHARQVYDWLWKKSCRSFSEMSNISKSVRERLEKDFTFPVLRIETEQQSRDKTIKTIFRLSDGLFIEGVLIPDADRTTACISSQAGCPLGCTFCATGQFGYKRNLQFTEIFDQVAELNRQSLKQFSIPLSNIVLMGMGEPLLNYEEVKKAVEMITSEDGLAMSPQRITLSSVGIPPMIRKLADDRIRYHFALSLHAADNAKRSSIIPLNKKHPLEELTESLKYFYQATKKRITIEYLLFNGFNDSIQDAQNLALFCRNFPVKVNLIEYNPVEGTGFRKPDKEKTQLFREHLEKKNMVVNVRRSRGGDIDAACGQLALRTIPEQ